MIEGLLQQQLAQRHFTCHIRLSSFASHLMRAFSLSLSLVQRQQHANMSGESIEEKTEAEINPDLEKAATAASRKEKLGRKGGRERENANHAGIRCF